ncbi:hypothetical protein [Roseivirga sp.]|uniref:hypothetical protein n=1 Tax=Roseivirga sp. TaxID=1964215 RepID=UPI003B51E515
MKLIKAFLFFLTLALTACGGADNEQTLQEAGPPSETLPTTAELVLKDSIMIDVMGNLSIYDYNARTGLFLAGDIGAGIIMMGARQKFNTLGHLVIDQKGQIIQQFKRFDRGPEGFGSNAMDNFFIGDSTIGVLSKLGLFQYGLDGSFIKKYKEINTLDFIGFSQHKIAAADDKGNLALGLAKGLEEAGRAWDSLFQIVKPMRFYDLNAYETGYEALETGEKAKYGFPDDPVYYPENDYGVRQFPPHVVYNDARKEVYVMYPKIKVLEVYDMETGESKGEIDLAPEHFGDPVKSGSVAGAIGGYEGLAWLNRGGRMASSDYLHIIQLGEYTLLRYSTAIPMDVLNPLINAGYRKDDRWPSVRREHYKFYYQLFKDGKKVVPDFQIPQLEPQKGQMEFNVHSLTRGVIVGGDGLNRLYVYMPNDGDFERDYELIYVYEIRLK